MSPAVLQILFIAALNAFSAFFCTLVWRQSPRVRTLLRTLGTLVVISLASWVFVVAVSLTSWPLPLSHGRIDCAVFAFGWILPWIAGVPVLLFSFLLRCGRDLICWMLRKSSGIRLEEGDPFVFVLIVWLFAVLVLPAVYFCWWHSWR